VQPPETVVADGRADRGEDEVWRQARQEVFYSLADGSMAVAAASGSYSIPSSA